MLLVLDIGNTNVTIGVFECGGDETSKYTPKATWRMATDQKRMPDEYGLLLHYLLPLRGVDPKDVKSVALCSVVPPLTATFVELCRDYFTIDPLVVGSGVKTGIRVLYDNPRDVGADRIVDAAAAIKLYGGPAIVVDFGTATVFDAVTASGDYLGGSIVPGIGVSADALFHSTSQLRRVPLERPPSAIGRNTIHAIQSGLILGYAEMVKGMVARFDQEMGGNCKIIATGGLARLIETEAEVFNVINVDLTLAGLRIVHELNS